MIVLQFVSIGVVYANSDWKALCVGRALQGRVLRSLLTHYIYLTNYRLSGCSIGGISTFFSSLHRGKLDSRTTWPLPRQLQFLHRHWGAAFLNCFKGTNLKRTATSFLATISQQVIGVIFVLGYLPYFLTLAGISRPFNWTMHLSPSAYWLISRHTGLLSVLGDDISAYMEF